jgi:DNA ligase-1
MKASPVDLNKLKLPVFVSAKIDGIRCGIVGDTAQSITGKPIRNKFVQSIIGNLAYEGLDGELTVGDPAHPNVMQATSSGVMAIEGEPDFTFNVFDMFNTNPNMAYSGRLAALSDVILKSDNARLRVLPQKLCHTIEGVEAAEIEILEQGYEGVMLRDPYGLYKNGRSTAREGALLKLKRFEHAEATIIGFEELMHNENALERNELGLAKRSEHADGLVPSGMLGAYVVASKDFEKTFKVSAGSMSLQEKKDAWQKRDALLHKILRFKYFPHGVKDVPRHPLYAGLRHPDDFETSY